MKVQNIKNIEKFFGVIDDCKGRVELVTGEGDRLNLKSKLCQLIGFTTLIQGGQIAEAKFECSEPEDEAKLYRFNLFGDCKN